MSKELKLYLSYCFIYLFFNFSLSLFYVNEIIFFLSQFLSEGLIIHDTTIWVWSILFITIFITFWFTIPYFLYLVLLWLKTALFKNEFLFIKLNLSVFFIILICSIYIYINDLFFAGFLISTIDKIVFEFQPELQNYLLFITGLFNDLISSLLIFQLFILIILKYKNIYQIKTNLLLIFYVFQACIYYYWFGSEGFNSDCFLILILINLYWILNFSFLFLKNLKKIKSIKT